ncbi:MAG TPA: hypothetical protein VI855_06185 [Dehalococcoidia bacterium]|nr:hypothetical protein [Dehalococcoidia bacterium]
MLQTGKEQLQMLLSVVAMVAFIAGYVLSIIAGIWAPDSAVLILILVILGLIVGLLNITGKEIIPYLIAAIALIIVGNFEAFTPLNDVVDGLGDYLNDIVGMMAIFSAPAAVIQAIRAGIALAKPSDGS